ncbi:DUF4033 domain-containing protein [Clostridium swellfunianum]|uniref:DUF4033 domain-containing protein n=1 Tax=Clostridium swellfunianum TaxID=1367462 RepID=UPI00202E58FE|nr:DUF4033 domain-containing protein [Clostridium swellfunianum]MCM0648655.1 DUF4033 domain-containing protein [Clostridium swellfunianum]
MREVILWITAATTLILTFHMDKKKRQAERQLRIKKYKCKYNEQIGCYGMCCNLCDIKKECQKCCGENNKYCGGLTEEV